MKHFDVTENLSRPHKKSLSPLFIYLSIYLYFDLFIYYAVFVLFLALFASSLNEYYIINPAFYLNKHMLQKLSWKTIKNVLPDRFYTSINFNHRKYNLELFRKRDLLRNDFHLEDEQDDKFIERQNPNSKRKLVCYYSGRVLNDPDTRVSLSICDGLVSTIFM